MNKRLTAIFIFSTVVLGLFILSIIHLPIKSQPATNTSITIPTPISIKNYQQASLSFIQQSNTTLSDMIKVLGNPDGVSTSEAGINTFIYNPDKNHRYQVYTLENKPIVAIDTDYKTNPTLPSVELHILYDQSSKDGVYSWHVFPEAGVGYLLNSQDNTSIMTQYFQPMTYDEYLQSVGKTLNLSEAPPAPAIENF